MANAGGMAELSSSASSAKVANLGAKFSRGECVRPDDVVDSWIRSMFSIIDVVAIRGSWSGGLL